MKRVLAVQIAVRALAMAEETLWHNQVEFIPRARHGDIKTPPLLLDFGLGPGCEIRGDATAIAEAMLGPGPAIEAKPETALPIPPNFANKRASLQRRSAQLVALAETGDLDGLMSVEMLPPNATSPKQLHRYRDACIAALRARGLPR
jgi:hypothetical protein